MEKQSVSLKNAELLYAKVSSLVTPTAWSQVYRAGSLFAILSLKYKEIPENVIPLADIGKEVINTLEEEYFSLETKNFNSVKEAVLKSIEKLPNSVIPSFLVAVVPPGKDTILYVYMQGSGTILLKRGEKVGSLVQPAEDLTSASGILENNDVLVLLTDSVTKTISTDDITALLTLSPQEAGEQLEARLTNAIGEEAGVVIQYKKNAPVEVEVPLIIPDIQNLQQAPETPEYIVNTPSFQEESRTIKFNSGFVQTSVAPLAVSLITKTKGLFSSLTHQRRMAISISIVLALILFSAGFLAIKKQQDAKNQELVQKVLDDAQKKYNEGSVLVNLNKSLAKSEFEEAQKILTEGKKQFTSGSKEEIQIAELLNKVQSGIEQTSGTEVVNSKEIALSASPLLSPIVDKKALFATSDDTTIFYLTSDGVFSKLKSSSTEKKLFDSSTYDSPGGLGTFMGNVYILDKKAGQILKFPSGSKDNKANYILDSTSVSDGVSLAIDSSIYVLNKDGTIVKFTKGKKDTFAISGLDNTFKNPIGIFTTSDTANVYVLDPENSRVVVFGKTGAYSSQLSSPVIKNATSFEVLEKQKKLYILQGGKLYELALP